MDLQLDLLGWGALGCATVMLLVWARASRTGNYAWIDVAWAANFLPLAVLFAVAGEGAPWRRILIAAMFCVWSLRLALHLFARVRAHGDARYDALRARFGARHRPLFAAFFAGQALLNVLLCAPLLLASADPSPTVGALEIAGVLLWLLGVSGEALADAQLRRFKAQPGHGALVCDRGLWAWSRHPNYFCESLVWWGFGAFALASPGGWIALSAPLLMTWLLLEVTGVRPAEEQALRSRGDRYRDYQARVSRFVPWFPGGLAGSAAAMRLLESGLVPDALLRAGIRSLLRRRLLELESGAPAERAAREQQLVERLERAPLAVDTDAANAQHYELPPQFFVHCLGPRLKYSCAYFPRDGEATLAAAEIRMLELTMRRAAVGDGERILELGCGWGSLTLFMAERLPASRIVAVSNAAAQRHFILQRARERGLRNIEVLTCDVNDLAFPPGTQFDRVVSVEMFEHVRNHRQLMGRIGSWLAPGATLFVHVFSHRAHTYLFEARDSSDWMARYFFTGGLMPADSLLPRFQETLRLEHHWRIDGRHYQRTAEAWLENMTRNRVQIEPLLRATYGELHWRRWWVYWRTFFMACAELWGYRRGSEWLVSHYLFRAAPPAAPAGGT